ncbi:hypothetical protein MMC30_001570 [Trapelia coarctata]|nr:hypothetical protein [Trapelia coarctata]
MCHVKVTKSGCRRHDEIHKAHPCNTTTYICCDVENGLTDNCNVTTPYEYDDEEGLCDFCSQQPISETQLDKLKVDLEAHGAQKRALQQKIWEQNRELTIRGEKVKQLLEQVQHREKVRGTEKEVLERTQVEASGICGIYYLYGWSPRGRKNLLAMVGEGEVGFLEVEFRRSDAGKDTHLVLLGREEVPGR